MGWTYDEIVSKVESGELIEPSEGCQGRHLLYDPGHEPLPRGHPRARKKYYIGQSDEEVRIRRDGEFVAKTGLVFPNFKKETHVIDPWMPPRDWKWYSSVDFGWNNPTAWLWHAVSPQGDIVTFAEHYTGKMTIPQHVSHGAHARSCLATHP
jgi:hypothetical protein